MRYGLIYITLWLNIILDWVLTDKALSQGGFYETNKFTNFFGLTTHFLLLTLITFLAWQASKHTSKPITKDIINGLVTIMLAVWTVNNAISIYYLYLFP